MSGRDREPESVPSLTVRPTEVEDRPSAATARALQPRAFAASALLHAAILAALIGLFGSAPLPDEPVVKVTLLTEGPGAAGASGGAGGGGAAEDAESAPAAAPEAEHAEPSPPQPEASEAPESPAPPVPDATPQPRMATAAPALTAEALPPPPRRKPKPPRPHPIAAPAAPAQSEASPAPSPPQPQPQPTQLAAAPTPVPMPGAPGAGSGPGGSGGAGTGAEGAGHGAIGNGPIEGPGDDYLDRLRRWLNKYKHYPKAALKQKQEGGLVVSFGILRDGTVVNPAIEHSSGFPLLDQAALRMLQDASPVPPLPPTYRAPRVEISLPVDFSIGFFDKLF